MPAPELAIFVGGFVLLAVILAIVTVHSINDARETTRASLREIQRVISSSLVSSTGLNPHVVDPERFGPTGMMRSDEEKQVPLTTAGPRSEAVSEEEELLREAEAEYNRLRSGYASDGARLTRPGAPPGANLSST